MKAASLVAGLELDSQSGQASVFLLLILATFLLASVGFAVDLSSMWFHRQAAQSAADAACVAGAMDMLYLQKGTITSSPGFTVGTAGDCSSSSTAALCKYAAFNGYTATTSAAAWGTSTPGGAVAVNWAFPSSLTGVTATSGVTYPFLKVVVQEKPNTWFMGMVGVKSLPVGASCTCGLPPGTPSAPLVILNPTISSSLTLSGGAHIVIAGGPATSIQVNSSANGSPSGNASSNAVYCNGGNGYPIDTSTAGPSGTGGKCGRRRWPHHQSAMRCELHHEQHHSCSVEESRGGRFRSLRRCPRAHSARRQSSRGHNSGRHRCPGLHAGL